MKDVDENSAGPTESRNQGRSQRTEYLNYFGKDRRFQLWFADKRTKLTAAILPPLVRIGLAPDTISYIGISLLSGVILYFVRDPPIAVLFLAGHIICDGLDGSYARHTGKASQSGAFTDLVCDQLGMIVVATLALFHHLAPPLLGAIYVSLYLIVVVFGVIINVMGLGTRITITSKYILYAAYLIWAVTERNYIPLMMTVFSCIMAVEVSVGYLRLKRGIRRKFDAEVRFTEGDPYSGRLNYAFNVAIPIIVFIFIIVYANAAPIRASFERPTCSAQWNTAARPVPLKQGEELLGVALFGPNLIVMTRGESAGVHFRECGAGDADTLRSFVFPSYFEPAFGDLPVDAATLFAVDKTTRLLMGIDLEASFSAGYAVITLTLPLGHLRVTGMAIATVDGKKRWLAANYLYTRRTYVVDPEKALKKGALLGGVTESYVNCGFPSGMTVIAGRVVEFNNSPFGRMLFAAPLSKVTARGRLLGPGTVSLQPPLDFTFGPIAKGEHLVGVSHEGLIFSVPLKALFP